jgi:pimeloyl-ACP methyl ester carboxylesterase
MYKRTSLVFALSVAILLVAAPITYSQSEPAQQSGYAEVNGLNMYYEIHGSGSPLIVLHGALMAIPTMGEIIPRLAETRQVIAVELQGHGRTADIIDRPLSYEQMADDVAAFMAAINLEQADVFGYSMGGGVALQLAMRHPEKIDRLVIASAGYSTAAYYPGFFDMLQLITADMFAGSPPEVDYQQLAPQPENFPQLVEKMVQLDSPAQDWPAADVQALESPTLIIIGDSDSIRPEHAVDLFRLRGGGVDGELAGLPNAQLAILPGTTHIGMLFRVDWLESMITEFLDAPAAQ